MKFRLFYRGPLRADGNPQHKQEIRRKFLPQLRTLWSQPPLDDVADIVNMDPAQIDRSKGDLALGEARGAFIYVPLVSSKLEMIAELDIILLRPEEPGQIVTQAGDIDNRLKTLLDSLQVPKIEQVPLNDKPSADEHPFYCLVEDDNLITSLRVTTDRLLDNPSSLSEVVLMIHVMAEFTHQYFTNRLFPPELTK